MLQEDQVTSAPKATKVSIKTAVWMVMCKQPATLAPFNGWVGPYFFLMYIKPGISFSDNSISFLPNAAREISATL